MLSARSQPSGDPSISLKGSDPSPSRENICHRTKRVLIILPSRNPGESFHDPPPHPPRPRRVPRSRIPLSAAIRPEGIPPCVVKLLRWIFLGSEKETGDLHNNRSETFPAVGSQSFIAVLPRRAIPETGAARLDQIGLSTAARLGRFISRALRQRYGRWAALPSKIHCRRDEKVCTRRRFRCGSRRYSCSDG